MVDDGAIAAACKLASYIQVFHAGAAVYDADARTQLLAAWLMGLRSGTPQFKTITQGHERRK